MKALLLASAAFLLLAGPMARAEEVAVVVQGKPRDGVESYKADGKLYLDAKNAGDLYGGSVYWYAVSGRVQLSIRGRALQLVVGSNEATAGDQKFKMSEPVIVRASRAFVPLSFLTGADFSAWAGFQTRYDERTKTVIVEKTGTVGAPRAFSFKGRTRVAVELAPGAAYSAKSRGVGAAEVVFDFGAAEDDVKASVDDGVVDSYSLKQEAKLVRLSVKFAQTGLRWRALELADPRRVAIDVFAPGAEMTDEPAAVKAPAKPAEKPKDLKVVKQNTEITESKEPKREPETKGKKRRLIVIDPGHGGKDPGATGSRGTREKDVNLAAGLELARVLRERGDFDVVLTREEDVFIPLSERSELANEKNADLFVSLHCNAAGNRRENGFEVYSVSETASDPEAEAIAAAENSALQFEGKNAQDETAKMILLAMTKTEMINESAAFSALAAKAIAKHVDVAARGAKQAGFYVLRGTHAPAILVEMAYVSHAKEEALLASRRFRRTMAEGVAAGVADYARRQGWLE